MGVSRRAYAAMRGVDERAVRKALAAGRIVLEPDGTIDPARADAMWDARTDPARQRGRHARELAARTQAAVRAAGGMKPVPRQALAAVAEALGDGGGEAAPDAGDVSFVKARLANEIVKAQMAKVRLAKAKGDLVDRAKAVALVFDLARRERDAWIGWPARVAATMAAELGADPRQVEDVLDRHLREHLAEMADVRVEIR